MKAIKNNIIVIGIGATFLLMILVINQSSIFALQMNEKDKALFALYRLLNNYDYSITGQIIWENDKSTDLEFGLAGIIDEKVKQVDITLNNKYYNQNDKIVTVYENADSYIIISSIDSIQPFKIKKDCITMEQKIKPILNVVDKDLQSIIVKKNVPICIHASSFAETFIKTDCYTLTLDQNQLKNLLIHLQDSSIYKLFGEIINKIKINMYVDYKFDIKKLELELEVEHQKIFLNLHFEPCNKSQKIVLPNMDSNNKLNTLENINFNKLLEYF